MSLEVTPVQLGALLNGSHPETLQEVSLGTGGAPLPEWAPFLSGLVISTKRGTVTVARVLPGSSAGESGVKPGDTILAADGASPLGVNLEEADHRSKVSLRIANSTGVRVVNIEMRPVTEIVRARCRQPRGPLTSNAGF